MSSIAYSTWKDLAPSIRFGFTGVLFVALLLGIGFAADAVGLKAGAGWAICLSLLFTYFGTILWAFKLSGGISVWKAVSSSELLGIACAIFLSEAFVIAEIVRDRFVYFYDYGGYWGITINESRAYFETPTQQLGALWNSINTQDYNNIGPSLLALPMHIMGEAFLSYALIVFNLFLLPTILTLATIAARLLCKGSYSRPNMAIIVSAILLSPALYYPVFWGYLDAVALLPAAMTLLLSFRPMRKRLAIDRCGAIAMLLILAMLGRRYFLFFCFGVAVSMGLQGILSIMAGWGRHSKLVSTQILRLACVGGLCGSILLLFFPGFVHRSLSSDLPLALSAYNIGGYGTKFYELASHFGVYSISLAAIGMLVCVWVYGFWSYAVFLATSALITLVCFFRVQSMATHHYYLTLGALLPFIVVGMYGVTRLVPSGMARNAAIALVTAFWGWNFLDSFSLVSPAQFGIPVFSGDRYSPKIRGDLSVLNLLVHDLAILSESKMGIYVIAGSTVLNDDILRKLYMPDTVNCLPSLRVSAQVDLRDGFPREFLSSDIVVLAEPRQYHLSPMNQQVIGILATAISADGLLRRHFESFKEYQLDHNVRVTVLRKVSSFSTQELTRLRELFAASYPGYPELFEQRIY